LFWDSANNRLGVGTSSPSYGLSVINSNAIMSGFLGSSAGITSLIGVYDSPTAANASYTLVGTDTSGGTTGFGSGGNFISVGHNGTGATRDLILHNYDSANIKFATANTERMRIDSSGNVYVGGTTQNTATAPIYASNTCKAWVDFVGSSAAIQSSFNVSSITRISTGIYTVNFTNAFADTKYTMVVGSEYQNASNSPALIFGNTGTSGTKTTSAYGVVSYNSSFSFYDAPQVYLAFFR